MQQESNIISQRARPGKGARWYYGLDPARLAAQRQRIEDSGASARLHLAALESFTAMFLDHAADLAKSGSKDGARNWVRFFRNSCALEVLADYGRDVAGLRAKLQAVESMCHPADAPSWETDIEAIRACLSEILEHVKDQTATAYLRRNSCGVHAVRARNEKTFERAEAKAQAGLAPFPSRIVMSSGRPNFGRMSRSEQQQQQRKHANQVRR